VPLQDPARRFQADRVRRILAEIGGNVSETVRRLDTARSYVYKLTSGLGIEQSQG
jgi:ActR/RegA family two-component response regulator